MSSKSAIEFLKKHAMSPESVDPEACAHAMLLDMEKGLAGEKSDMPMIPTYLKNDGQVPLNVPTAVIDAGGTNFRRALVTFTADGYRVEQLHKCAMPGTQGSATWEEFISFTAEQIMPLMDKTDCIGFCFSYTAVTTPNIDGRVVRMDKEICITGEQGKLVGASLKEELEKRGVYGKHIVVLNDTPAVLLGGSAVLDKTEYSGFVGQVSGTGTNTCCILPRKRIGKLHDANEGAIIVNLESGLFDGMPVGDFDRELDKNSNNPGLKQLEKLTAGVYLGELSLMILRAAAKDGLMSAGSRERLEALPKIDSAVIDAWASGERLELAADCEKDAQFVKTVCLAMFERSARCMCANLCAIMLLTGTGKTSGKPMCVCAEGSLVQKSRHYLPMLRKLLDEYAFGVFKGHIVIRLGNEATFPGSAAAALLNR